MFVTIRDLAGRTAEASGEIDDDGLGRPTGNPMSAIAVRHCPDASFTSTAGGRIASPRRTR